MQEAVMVIGLPASGKTSLVQPLVDKGYTRLNRDTAGGKVADLLPIMQRVIKAGESVVMDNIFGTVEVRKPFLDACKSAGVPVRCMWMSTAKEDCAINALFRQHKMHRRLFLHPSDLKGLDCPNTFPIAAIFASDKEFIKPDKSEGWASIEKVKFDRKVLPSEYCNSAVIFDYDDTLRRSKGEHPWPTKADEVELLPNRREKVQELIRDKMLLLGVSNQSTIAKGLPEADARACFERTNELLGTKIEYHFCPHNVPPVCYCRKPASGLAVLLIEKHKLDPAKCIYVGDQTTDRTFAQRIGFQYIDQVEYFKV